MTGFGISVVETTGSAATVLAVNKNSLDYISCSIRNLMLNLNSSVILK